MVVAFSIVDWIFALMNAITMISCRHMSYARMLMLYFNKSVFVLGKLELKKFKRRAECSTTSGWVLWCWSGKHTWTGCSIFPSLSSVEEEESKLQLCDELMIRTLSRSKARVEFVMMQTLELF